MQHWLFSNSTSIGHKGSDVSNGFAYAMPLPVIVYLGVNVVLFSCNANDIMPVLPGNMQALFLTVSGTDIC